MVPTSADLATHRTPRSVFDEFCSGPVAETSMAAIKAGQHSLRRLRLLALLDVLPVDVALEQAWSILVDVDDRSPEIVADVLMHPSVGVWLMRALRVRQADWNEFGYLYSLVAAAAVRAGHPCDIEVPVMGGIVSLPTVGAVRLPWSSVAAVTLRNYSTRSVFIISGEESIEFAIDAPSACFSPTSRHQADFRGIRLDVEINDTDPYREFVEPLPPLRLDAAELTHWRTLLDDAWSVLTERHSGYARELSSGLNALIPARAGSKVAGASCSAAFGGVVLSAKNSATGLAEVLVHELQHSKLNAMLDLVSLEKGVSDRFWYAPWRVDSRPLVGLLHGIYAFVSVVEFWRIEHEQPSEPELSRAAQFAFAHRRNQVREAVDAARSAPELTELGRQLVETASERLTVCESVEVPADLLEVVRQMSDDNRITWRLRHARYDDTAIRCLATAWLNHQPTAPPLPMQAAIAPSKWFSVVTARADLLEAKVVDPGRFAELVLAPDRLDGPTPEADAAYAAGDHERAAEGYSARIRQVADDTHAWAGLALTTAALRDVSDVVFAIHGQVLAQGGPPPEPLELAAWIG